MKQTKRERVEAEKQHRSAEVERLKAEAEWAGWCGPRPIKILFATVGVSLLLCLAVIMAWMYAEKRIDHWQDVASDAQSSEQKAKRDYHDAWMRVEFLAEKSAIELMDDEIRWIWHVDAGGEVPAWLLEKRGQ